MDWLLWDGPQVSDVQVWEACKLQMERLLRARSMPAMDLWELFPCMGGPSPLASSPMAHSITLGKQ